MGKRLERFGEVRIIDETNGFGPFDNIYACPECKQLKGIILKEPCVPSIPGPVISAVLSVPVMVSVSMSRTLIFVSRFAKETSI